MTSVFYIDSPPEKHSVSWYWMRDSGREPTLFGLGLHTSERLTDEHIATIETTEIHVEQRWATNLPDKFGRFTGPYIVSERAKAIIENFEPGAHQFIRVSIKDRRGVSPDQPYWLLHILNTADGFDIEQSKLIQKTMKSGQKFYSLAAPGAKRVIEPERVKGLHLWRDKNMDEFYASEEFKRAAMEERLTGLKFKKCELVKRNKGGAA